MRQNYRNAPSILSFAKKFLYRLGPSYTDDSVAMRKQTESTGVMEANLTPQEAVRELIRVKALLNTTWGDWFILCRTNADVELFQLLLEKQNVPCDTFKQAELTNSEIENKMKEDTVKVLTVHSAKGLENKCVLSYNVRAYKDEEARVCYVSATRARDVLFWVRAPKKKKIKMVSWE